MSDEIRTSLIVTTYNWPEALRIVLTSVVNQKKCPDEVIIADDGSGEETAETIREILGSAKFRWCHTRHRHLGVRQSRIKNLAVKHAGFPYLIFIDHDVILHPEFIADHLAMAEKGMFLQGKRCLLTGPFTGKVIEAGGFDHHGIRPWQLKNKKNGYRSPKLGRFLSRSKKFETSLRGCNLSMFRSDFLRADGFDEIYDQSWGREDSDICYRLFHSGVRVKTLWFMALQYHLYHGTPSGSDMERLDQALRKCVEEKRVKALKGFSQLSDEGEVVAAMPRR